MNATQETRRPVKYPPPPPVEYAGQWIAWNADRTEVLAHGLDMDSVHEEAVRKGEPTPLLQRVCRPDRILIG